MRIRYVLATAADGGVAEFIAGTTTLPSSRRVVPATCTSIGLPPCNREEKPP